MQLLSGNSLDTLDHNACRIDKGVCFCEPADSKVNDLFVCHEHISQHANEDEHEHRIERDAESCMRRSDCQHIRRDLLRLVSTCSWGAGMQYPGASPPAGRPFLLGRGCCLCRKIMNDQGDHQVHPSPQTFHLLDFLLILASLEPNDIATSAPINDLCTIKMFNFMSCCMSRKKAPVTAFKSSYKDEISEKYSNANPFSPVFPPAKVPQDQYFDPFASIFPLAKNAQDQHFDPFPPLFPPANNTPDHYFDPFPMMFPPGKNVHDQYFDPFPTMMPPPKINQDKAHVADQVITSLYHATSTQTLEYDLQQIVNASGWCNESIAEAILRALEIGVETGKKMNQTLAEAYQKSRVAYEKAVLEHPYLATMTTTVVCLGILYLLWPAMLAALGFGEEGVIAGMTPVMRGFADDADTICW